MNPRLLFAVTWRARRNGPHDVTARTHRGFVCRHPFKAMQLLAMLALPLAASGCSVQHRSHPVVEVRYLEIPVRDIDRAVAFYEAVFTVTLERVTVDGYAMAHFPTHEGQQGADVTLAQGDVYVPTKSGVIVYFSVASIDAVIARAKQHGSSLLYDKKEVAPGLWVAEFEDSEGNRIALSERDR